MKYEDTCGNVHRQQYGRSDKANAFDNQNSEFREGYAWGIETYAYDADKVLKAEMSLRGEFKIGTRGYHEWKRGFWSARNQMKAAGIRKRAIAGSPLD